MISRPPLLALLALALLAPSRLPAKTYGPVAGEPPIDLVLQPGQLELRPSFITCSYYYRPRGAFGGKCTAEFRRKGDGPWRPTLEAVCDLPAEIWKGSVFGLREDSVWQLRVLSGDDRRTLAEGEFRTWSSHPPIARVVDLSKVPGADRGGLVISDQGTPEAWIKYVVPAGWVLRRAYDPDDPHLAAITFKNARYVILEGATVVGGWRYGILVDESESVRIANCEVSRWGRMGVQQFTNDGNRGKSLDAHGALINLDGGIEINRSLDTVVERCYVHDPRWRSNSWMFSHPSGPEAMHINYARGGTVLRWNDFVGSDEHRWNDVIESSSNSSPVGGFYRDSDITGNFQTFGEDDGIELEGGGMNVRYYGNKVEGTTCGVSTGACLLGPQYVFHNVVANLGDESGLALYFFKNSHGVPQGGRRYFVNNTLYGFEGTAYGSYGNPLPKRIGFMRNNVFLCSDYRPPGPWARRDDFDDDLFWVKNSAAASRRFLSIFQGFGQEAHGLDTDPNLVDPDGADYHLATDSVARGRAVAVANVGPAGEDLGAFTDGYDEVPLRPLALMAEPRQLKFSDPKARSSAEVTLTLPAGEKQPVAFRIRQNEVFDWFKVEPSSGELHPGDTLKLRVTIDAAKIAGRPLFKGAFLVRTPEGLSRPVLVYAHCDFTEDLRPAVAPNSVYLDVADLPGLAKFAQTTAAPGVSGGKYVSLRSVGMIDAEFNLARAGSYSLLARTSVEGDVLHRYRLGVSLDGAGRSEAAPFSADYQWNVGNRRFRVVYLYALGRLAPGKHRLGLTSAGAARDANQLTLDLNQLIVTDNPAVFFPEYWLRERKP